ncbi:MAG: hypothetical protein ACTSP4_12345 [Candidatus Hodarchaeales archaeon]
MQSVLKIKPATSSLYPLAHFIENDTDRTVADISIVMMNDDFNRSEENLQQDTSIISSWYQIQENLVKFQNILNQKLFNLLDFMSKVEIDNNVLPIITENSFINTYSIFLYLYLIKEFFKELNEENYSIKIYFSSDPEYDDLSSITFKILVPADFDQVLIIWTNFEHYFEHSVKGNRIVKDFPIFFDSIY